LDLPLVQIKDKLGTTQTTHERDGKCYQFLAYNPKGQQVMEHLSTNGRIILNRCYRTALVGCGLRFNWLNTGINKALANMVRDLHIPQNVGNLLNRYMISWLYKNPKM